MTTDKISLTTRGRWLAVLLLACAAGLLDARVAHACSCAGKPTVLEQYDWAEVVVVTRVVSLEKSVSAKEIRPGGVAAARMVVEKVYKGQLRAGDEMVFAQGGGTDCIYTFDDDDIGRRHLFYLKPLKDASIWIAGTCGRSRPIEYAGDDLLYLNNLDKTRGRTRLSGTLYFWGSDGPDLAGLKLRIVGAKKSHELKTDEHGVYEIYDLPAGRYWLQPEVPPGWKVNGNSNPAASLDLPLMGLDVEAPTKKAVPLLPFVIEDKKHTALDLRFEIDNAVRGKVFDTTGKPMDRVCLDLIPAEESREKPYLADCTENGGAFEIDEIPPGDYILILNDDGEVSGDEPFTTFYYPNVSKREEATVFHIGAGDFVEDLQVFVPKMVETVTVEGVFLYSDGKPVVGEWAEFYVVKDGDKKDEDEAEAAARAQTDAKGRFSVKILKGQKGTLHGEMYTYIGEFENCPKLESIIKKTGGTSTELKTPAIEIQAETNLYGLELRYPFPGCKKAK